MKDNQLVWLAIGAAAIYAVTQFKPAAAAQDRDLAPSPVPISSLQTWGPDVVTNDFIPFDPTQEGVEWEGQEEGIDVVELGIEAGKSLVRSAGALLPIPGAEPAIDFVLDLF